VAIAKLAPHHLVTPLRFFSGSWASWGSTTWPSNASSSLRRVDALERKPCAVVAAQYRSPQSAAPFSVLSDFGPPSSFDVQQIADKRRAISAFGVGLAPSVTVSIPEVPAQGKCLARHHGA
jgi:hypothetical protein